MDRRLRIALFLGILGLGYAAFILHARASFPDEKTPEGAYARIAVAITEGRPRDCFAYLETQSQWAAYSILDFRRKILKLVEESYPDPLRGKLVTEYAAAGRAEDGADIWALYAES